MNNQKQPLKAKHSLEYQIKIAFWLPIYLKLLALFCTIFRVKPDADKLDRTLQRGMKVVRVKQRKSACVLIA